MAVYPANTRIAFSGTGQTSLQTRQLNFSLYTTHSFSSMRASSTTPGGRSIVGIRWETRSARRAGPGQAEAETPDRTPGFVVEADQALVGQDLPLPVVRRLGGTTLAAAAAAAGTDGQPQQGDAGQQSVQGAEGTQIGAPQAAGGRGELFFENLTLTTR